jgi:hypothetical protein
MREQRQTPRTVVDQILEVNDQVTGTSLGRVVNISAEGFMLLSEEPVITGSVYQLSLIAPQPSEMKEPIKFGAEVVWCTEASQPESYWSGFHIIDISNDDALMIDEMIISWHSSEASGK